MKPALEKFLLIAATLAAIGIFIYVSLWTSIKTKKSQMDELFNSTNVPTSYVSPSRGPSTNMPTGYVSPSMSPSMSVPASYMSPSPSGGPASEREEESLTALGHDEARGPKAMASA